MEVPLIKLFFLCPQSVKQWFHLCFLNNNCFEEGHEEGSCTHCTCGSPSHDYESITKPQKIETQTIAKSWTKAFTVQKDTGMLHGDVKRGTRRISASYFYLEILISQHSNLAILAITTYLLWFFCLFFFLNKFRVTTLRPIFKFVRFKAVGAHRTFT